MSSPTSELEFNLDKNIILKAGAGAGKTTTLIKTFIGFVTDFKKKNKKYPKIVLTTFTRKATQEIRERLLTKALENNDADLFAFISNRSIVQISTIHGVLNLFLVRFGNTIGLTPDFKLVSESDIEFEIKKILRANLFKNNDFYDLIEEYDFAQITQMVKSYYNSALFFTNLDYIHRDELLKFNQKQILDLMQNLKEVVANIKSTTENAKWLEYCELFMNVNENRDLVDILNVRKPSFSKANPPFSEELAEQFEDCREELKKKLKAYSLSGQFLDKHEKLSGLFKALADKTCQDLFALKIERGMLSMSDLELISYYIIQHHPDSAVQFSLDWDYWMIDEYQDNSPIQVKLLKTLIGNRKSFMVGDPQQSIYLFRGARSEVFYDRVSEVINNQDDFFEKMINYRSTPPLLEFFNDYFLKLDNQFSAMIPHSEKEFSVDDKVVDIYISESDEENKAQQLEANNVVSHIQKLINAGASPESICVLSKTKSTIERIGHLANSLGIPVQVHTSGAFYRRREIIDLLNISKFLVNPHDNLNLLSILRSPWFYIDDFELHKLANSSQGSMWLSANEAFRENKVIQYLKQCLSHVQTLGVSYVLRQIVIEVGIVDASNQIDPSGRREANIWKFINLLSDEEKRTGFNYINFLDNCSNVIDIDNGEGDADATPVIEPKRVNFMTVHASKGLQFDHVLIVDMNKKPPPKRAPMFLINEHTGIWTLLVQNPENSKFEKSLYADHIMSEFSDREESESNRVLYVAMTRAKKSLALFIDSKPVANTWAKKIPIDISVGEHRRSNYFYQIHQGNYQGEKMIGVDKQEFKVRPKWNQNDPIAALKFHSVTELVQEDVKIENKQAFELVELMKKAQRGTDSHKAFELLKYKINQKIDINEFPLELQSAVKFILNTKEIPLFEIIRSGEVEWGFSCVDNNNLLQGQIDLWAYIDEVLYVVDYKTGSSHYVDRAFAQLRYYSSAIMKILKIKPQQIVHAAVYPYESKIKILTDFVK